MAIAGAGAKIMVKVEAGAENNYFGSAALFQSNLCMGLEDASECTGLAGYRTGGIPVHDACKDMLSE